MIPLLLFLLACAMVYVGTVQAAFRAMTQLSLRLKAERAGGSDELERCLDAPGRVFVPARLLLGLVAILATGLLATVTGTGSVQSLGGLFAAMLVFVLACEHLVPLLIVRDRHQQVLETLLPSFLAIAKVFSPLTIALLSASPGRPRPASPESEPQAGAVAEAAPSPEGAESIHDGRELLRSIVGFSDRLVREVMTPRPDIVAVRAASTLDELRAFCREQEYSRMPVYKDSLDNILGMVFVKDLITRSDLAGEAPVTTIMRPAHFVPETKRVPDLLRDFQRNQTQSAIVVDEYGGTAGLVSLEDLLEEIVGEIRDEYDVEVEPFVEEPDGAYVVSGRAHVDELRERMGLHIEGEGFETVGGYLLSRIGRVPAKGETLDLGNLQVEVIEAEHRRIHRVRLRKTQPVTDTQ
jgi:CBS domain containing-hemolysin-like protein